MSTRVFGLLPLAKSSKRWQRTDTERSLIPACGIGQRSHKLETNFACLNFHIKDGAYEIYNN
jgi:hypothetical protein